MALLLDDDDVELQPTKLHRAEPVAPSVAPPVTVAHAGSGACLLAARGGNGVEKMNALRFGSPTVVVVASTAAAEAPRSSCGAATPPTQRGGRSGLSASRSTQPKVLYGSQSPTASSVSVDADLTESNSPISLSYGSPLSQLSQNPESPSRGVCTAESAGTGVFSRVDFVSKNAEPEVGLSPVAQSPPSPLVQVPARAGDQTPPSKVPPPAARTQMKLSDFFSKMSCKR